MKLSLRLSAAARMVTQGNRLVDVGCDHGYLPVYLVLEKKVPRAIAADVRKGPLSRAQEHIAEYGLEEYIETRLSDGLAEIAPGEGDTLVLAGMGGPLMERILSERREVTESFRELVLQPQSDVRHFRRFLLDAGWEIVEENMVEEDGKFYPLMKAVHRDGACPGGDLPASCGYSPLEEWFGKLLLSMKHPVLYEYLCRERRIRGEILDRLKEASGESSRKRIDEVKEEMQLILAALKQYESEGPDSLPGGALSGGGGRRLG